MFSKLISMILVYIVTIFNVMILFSPVIALAIPFTHYENGIVTIAGNAFSAVKFTFFFLMFLVSFLMLLYLFVDFLFGFSVRASLKNCTRYEKIKDYDFLTTIFDQVKNKFNEKSVKLYVKKTDEINAYAISSFGGKAIVLTSGLINHYLVEYDDPKRFLYSLRSIIGHEMSHLINKDFLPGFLIITNQKITNFVSRIIYLIFLGARHAVALTPYGGNMMSRIVDNAYTILNFSITIFNRLVVYNLYEFLRRFVSRSIEYRCDRQSAQAFGGNNMANALTVFGESGYFTLFSTHPGTKSRIKKAEKIKWTDSVIRPNFFDSLANYFSIMFLIVICLYFLKQAHIDLFLREYIKDHELIHRKLSVLWNLISRFF